MGALITRNVRWVTRIAIFTPSYLERYNQVKAIVEKILNDEELPGIINEQTESSVFEK